MRPPSGSRLQAAGCTVRRGVCGLKPMACSLQLVACSLLLVSTGCLHRSLTIRTEPPGALVYLNDQLKGESPVTYDFEWYGWHRVTIRKAGFERIEERKLLRVPPYLWIPFDLAMELAPFPVNDQRTLSYALTPLPPLPEPQPPQLTAPQKNQPASAAPTGETAQGQPVPPPVEAPAATTAGSTQ